MISQHVSSGRRIRIKVDGQQEIVDTTSVEGSVVHAEDRNKQRESAADANTQSDRATACCNRANSPACADYICSIQYPRINAIQQHMKSIRIVDGHMQIDIDRGFE